MKLAPVLATAALLAFAPSLAAETLRFHVPFPFVAHDSDFLPGDYEMTWATGDLPIRLARVDRQPGTFAFIVAGPARRIAEDANSHLRFECHGNLCLLREFQSSHAGLSLDLPLTPRRRALVRSYVTENQPVRQVLIAASR